MYALKHLTVAIILLASFSCRKAPVVKPQPIPSPTITYTDLTGKSVGFGQALVLDLDKNGKTDIVFSTLLTSDNINNLIKNRYLVQTSLYCKISVINDLEAEDEECQPFHEGDAITMANFPGQTWYNIASINLMRKMTNVSTNNFYWESRWINRGHVYLPLQLTSNNKTYSGWVELEADSRNEKLIFYRAAISTEPGKTIKAGS